MKLLRQCETKSLSDNPLIELSSLRVMSSQQWELFSQPPATRSKHVSLAGTTISGRQNFISINTHLLPMSQRAAEVQQMMCG